MSTPYRIAASALAWFAIVLQYVLIMTGDIGPGPIGRTVNFFSYFTILCNLLAAFALTAPWLMPHTAFGRFFMRPSVRAAIASYIIVVICTYHLFLRGVVDLQGWGRIVDTILHYVMPIVFVADWILFTPKRDLTLSDALKWLAFPAVYLAWTLIHGVASGFYPYPFMDVLAHGYGVVLLNSALVCVAFAGIGVAVVVTGRWLARRQPTLTSS